MRSQFRMMRPVGGVAVLVLVAGACSGAGGSGGGDGDGELTWAIGGADAQPGGVHQEIAELWSEENPDNPITIDVLPESADEQRQQQSLELNAEGSGFDVLGIDVIWTGEYSENGWLESLEDVRGDIESVSIPGAFQSATWGGELWAAPYNSNAGFLYYRTDLIDEPPTTWDEAKEMGLAAAEEAGIAAFVGQGAQYEGMVVNYLEYVWGAGGDLLNEDGSEVLYGTDDAATQALDFMRESLEDGFYAPGFNTMMEEEARNEFQSGNAVFMRNWPYAYALANTEGESEVAGNFDIAPLPTFTGEGTTSALGGFNNAVSAFSDNKEAAKEFVVWASTSPEVHQMLAEATLPPTLQSTYDDLQDDPVMALLGEVLPEARPRPPAPDWNGISVEIQQQVFPAYNGEGDPQAAVDAISEYLQGTIE
jgi:multiple sugar transport system substrate-binding protein